MKIQELNNTEMQQVNGGFLGLGNGNSSFLGGITNSLGLHVGYESHSSGDHDSYSKSTKFSLGLGSSTEIAGGGSVR
jgi:bacteriocin-like protein